MNFPTLTTKRLMLRVPHLDDLPAFLAFCASDRTRYIGGPNIAEKRAHWAFGNITGLWLLRRYSAFTACLKDGTPLGFVGPWYPTNWPEPEFAWSLWRLEYEGHGYITEAMQTLMPWAWNTLGLTTAVSYIDPENAASIAVAERLGGVVDPDARTPDGGYDLVYRYRSMAA